MVSRLFRPCAAHPLRPPTSLAQSRLTCHNLPFPNQSWSSSATTCLARPRLRQAVHRPLSTRASWPCPLHCRFHRDPCVKSLLHLSCRWRLRQQGVSAASTRRLRSTRLQERVHHPCSPNSRSRRVCALSTMPASWASRSAWVSPVLSVLSSAEPGSRPMSGTSVTCRA